jgi:hypothetical protein
MYKYCILCGIILATIIFNSCSQAYISGDVNKLKQCKSAALIEVAVLPHHVPSYDIVENEIFCKQLMKIKTELLAVDRTKPDTFEVYLGDRIKEYSQFEIKYGRDFLLSDEYQSLVDSVNTFSSAFNDEIFGEFTIATNNLNFIDYQDSIVSLFEYFSNKEVKKNFTRIAKILDVDCIIIALTGIVVSCEYRDTGVKWSRYNLTSLCFIDTTGTFFLYGFEKTNKDLSGVNNINNYDYCLNKFYYSSDKILRRIFDKSNKSFGDYEIIERIDLNKDRGQMTNKKKKELRRKKGKW